MEVKIEISINVDEPRTAAIAVDNALMALRYNYANWGSPYCLPKWARALRGEVPGIVRATHADSGGDWNSRLVMRNF